MTRFFALLAVSAVAVLQTQTAVADEAAPELDDRERAQLGRALEGLQPLAIERMQRIRCLNFSSVLDYSGS